MQKNNEIIFETKRLYVRPATIGDVDLFFALWSNPQVMSNVGFPQGLQITRKEIEKKIQNQGVSEFDQFLVIVLKSTGQVLGECKLHLPNPKGIARTDIKLLPKFWGNKFGVEIKRGLLSYLFMNTDCIIVEATPNIGNIASIKMQEAVGGQRIGESVYHFPEEKRDYTKPVHLYIYHVFREAWQGNMETEGGRSNMSQPKQCVSCETMMEDGFLLTGNEITALSAKMATQWWVEGEVDFSRWSGLDIKNREIKPVLAYRCPSCGRLDLFTE